MTWTAILVLAGGSYAYKAVGLLGFSRLAPRPWLDRVGRLIPPALLSALVVVQTVAVGTSLQVDARVVGLAAAGIAVWRRWPFIVVVLVAAAVTALTRTVA